MLLLLAVLAISCGCVSNEAPPTSPSKSMVNESINKAIDFLYLKQLENGEFATYECKDPEMKKCVFDGSTFITSFVLYSIQDVENKKVSDITRKGIQFLSSEQEKDGSWRYRTLNNPRRAEIDPDVDCTSTVSFVLKKNNISYNDNVGLINSNKNKDGLFLTYIREEPGQDNILDCGVNANVLFYLGESDPKVCAYINKAVKSDEKCSYYYPDNLALYYMISRAYKNKVACFQEGKNKIIQSTISQQKADGSFGNDLDTALAVDTLLNFDYTGAEVDKGISSLLKTQRTDGSWEMEYLYIDPYFGSEELTTALAIEALENYLHLTER